MYIWPLSLVTEHCNNASLYFTVVLENIVERCLVDRRESSLPSNGFISDTQVVCCMVIVCLLYGHCMVIVWSLYGHCMVIVCLLYGHCMVNHVQNDSVSNDYNIHHCYQCLNSFSRLL